MAASLSSSTHPALSVTINCNQTLCTGGLWLRNRIQGMRTSRILPIMLLLLPRAHWFMSSAPYYHELEIPLLPLYPSSRPVALPCGNRYRGPVGSCTATSGCKCIAQRSTNDMSGYFTSMCRYPLSAGHNDLKAASSSAFT